MIPAWQSSLLICFPDPVSPLTCGLCVRKSENRRKSFMDYTFFIWHLWLHCHRWKTEWRLSGKRSDWNRSVTISAGTRRMPADRQCSNNNACHRSVIAALPFLHGVCESMWVRGFLLWLIKFCWKEWPSTWRKKKQKEKKPCCYFMFVQ